MKIIVFIDITIGIWWGIMYTLMFNFFRLGKSIAEPDTLIATIELCVAAIFTCWFLWQLPYFIIKWRRKYDKRRV